MKQLLQGTKVTKALKHADSSYMHACSREAHDAKHPPERRSSVDLAAGLRCSAGATDEEANDIDLAASFNHFRSTSTGAWQWHACILDFHDMFSLMLKLSRYAGRANGTTEIFATPMARQGSLIAMQPLPSPVCDANEGRASTSVGGSEEAALVYCPVGIEALGADSDTR